MTMRIGMHLQALRPGQIGGLETYVRQLIQHLPEVADDVGLVLFCAEHNARTFVAGPTVEVQVLDDAGFAALAASHLRAAKLDLWFCPLLVLEPHEPGLPSAVTIPDMQHEAFPHCFPPSVLEWRREHYPRSATRADAVLTLSEFSREQIVQTLGIDGDVVHAIHLDAGPWLGPGDSAAPSHASVAEVRTRYQLPDEFLFYPANNWPHKNHAMLFTARRLAQAELGRPLPLILVGAEVDGRDPWARVISPADRADGVRHLGYVPESDLPALFGLSRALVFPSLFEGFGMPVLEAMRTGCPVLCSELPSLREITADAAWYFDPTSPEALAAGIVDVWTDGRDRPQVEDGRQRAATFSWERTAATTLEVFRSLVAPTVAASTPASATDEGRPLISVVTPSFNQRPFIEATLRSVLEQDYPDLEYWVLDGGSTDGTLEVIERYQRRYPDVLHYLSEPDGGQAAAVNKGFDRVRGEIIGWLNSDDTYEPGTLAAVAESFQNHPVSHVVYGRARHVGRDGEDIGEYPTQPAFRWHALIHQCFLCQPAVFMGRTVLDAGYRLDERLYLCLDYDLWIRLGRRFRFRFIDRHLANSRVYPENKSLSQQRLVLQEALDVIKRHYGWVPLSWATAWAHYHREGADAFFNVRPVTRTTYLAAFWMLVRQNWSRPRHWRKALHDVRGALTRSWQKRRLGLWPSALRTLPVPPGSLIVEVSVEVDGSTGEESIRIDLACRDRPLAAISLSGPGRHTRWVGVPRHDGALATRLTIASPTLRTGRVQPLPLEPFPAVSEDGWLEQEDTLRLPENWRAADIGFMVPTDGVQLAFRHRGHVVDEWTCVRAGNHRRQLRLHSDDAPANGIIDIDVSASDALPPDPSRGETRALAIRILDITECGAENAPA